MAKGYTKLPKLFLPLFKSKIISNCKANKLAIVSLTEYVLCK